MSRLSPLAALTWALAILCALLLIIPGRTITTAYVNDLLIFLDGAHRLVSGQVPNRDFHTSLGPVVYIIPALGFILSSRLGGAMPMAMGLLIIGFAPVAVHVLGSRLRLSLALPFAAFVILLLAAPVNLGEDIASLSFAMFYNRVGWAALALLLIMFLPRRVQRPSGEVLDVLCATLLVALQLYTKITYGVVAIGFLLFMVFDKSQRRWAILSLILLLVFAALIELFWQSSGRFVQDLVDTARVSGERDYSALLRLALYNSGDILLFGFLAILAISRSRKVRDLLLYGFCLASGLLLIQQNAHSWGIITLFTGAVIAGETLALGPRMGSGHSKSKLRATSLGAGAPLVVLLMLLPTIGRHLLIVALHFSAALSNAGDPLGLPNFADVRFARLWSGGDNGFSERYVASFAEGGALLESIDPPPARVLNLDFVNPFSAGLGLVPPRGDMSWMHWGRNINADQHLSPESVFADVDIVMEPKVGINGPQLESVYGAYVKGHYELLYTSQYWTLYRRAAEH